MFDKLQMAPPDPILGLTEAFKEDPNPQKINLGVGVFQDEKGRTPVMRTVKKAERILVECETTKNYAPISGSPEYGKCVQTLVLGEGSPIVLSGRTVTAHTPGGSGALRVAGEFLRGIRPDATVWVSDPTWPNHNGIFGAAGLKVKAYPYYDAVRKDIDFEKMYESVGQIPAEDVLLIHGCCHNPTGNDLMLDQWKKLAARVKERGIFPLVDFAYQGLAAGIEEDAAGVRALCDAVPEAIVCSSFSKNFGLYNERVGALTLIAAGAEAAKAAFSHIKIKIRQNYSNPPAHGALIISTILGNPALRAEWEEEVKEIRLRIRQMRDLFVSSLKAAGVKTDFSFITRQNGMFSFSGLTEKQVAALREKYSIYMVKSGRINVAGMTPANMPRLTQAVAEVLKSGTD
ncbi:MAG: aspartate/tyrosine/aromatic aminotransferase [Candidatus Sumerlaeota bacterium]|nr:aspartate/tyrosine/aromatic aminotransferase [Candidatus Sumerlaeota bacterium]